MLHTAQLDKVTCKVFAVFISGMLEQFFKEVHAIATDELGQ
jgi:hypothetical protein